MKLDDQFPLLGALLVKMGAELRPWSPDEAALGPLDELRSRLATGVEIGADEIEWPAGGLLSHKGQQVLLYIKDTRQSRERLIDDPESAKKFHIYHCNTLQKMIEDNRLERYVVTQRHDGLFPVISTEPDTKSKHEFETRLHVCKNCLDALAYNNYSRHSGLEEKRKHVRLFNIDEFFSTYSTFFARVPGRRDFEVRAADVGYVQNWARISHEFRSSQNWTCEQCSVSLSSFHSLLHAHHVDGNPQNNNRRNLQALCALCHALQPYHSQMRVELKARQRIEQARSEQREASNRRHLKVGVGRY